MKIPTRERTPMVRLTFPHMFLVKEREKEGSESREEKIITKEKRARLREEFLLMCVFWDQETGDAHIRARRARGKEEKKSEAAFAEEGKRA